MPLLRTSLSENARGSIFMMLAMAGFVVNDTFVKLASADVSVPQIMAVRGVMATALILLLAKRRQALRPPRALFHPILILRSAAEVLATVTYITALAQMQIANTLSIFQALPLTVTFGAALFLGEKVGWRRWTAIGVGFVGVLIIVQPGLEGFNSYSLAVLASVFFSATRDLATRKLPPETPSLFISLVTAAAVTLTGWAMLPFHNWVPLTSGSLALLACAAIAVAIGYYFIIQAMRLGEMGFVAPFRYSVLIYALVIGVLVFDDRISGSVLLGSAIVVGSGIYMLYRERTLGRLGSTADPTPLTQSAPRA